MRLRGADTITAKELLPGESVTSPLRVRADNSGRYQLTSPNFSYKDHLGRPHRVYRFAIEITVDPEPEPSPAPKVKVKVELETTDLRLAEWSPLPIRVANVGEVDVSDLAITVSGRVATEHHGKSIVLDQLRAGASASRSFSVLAEEAGTHVPIHLDLAYSGQSRRYHETVARTVSVSSTQAPEAVPARNLKILFFSANPRDTGRLRIDEEIREIRQTIRQGRERDNIEVRTEWAVRPRDITDALMDFQPSFVHFAGHGGGEEESFAAEDDIGRAHLIPVDGLVEAFKSAGGDVCCVIVNACQTERLARALAETASWVIGMRQPVGARSAIRFSIGFYQALAAGKPVEMAFRVGVAQLKMTPDGDDALAPLLLRGRGEAC
jgi:hypothetical protein